MARVVAERDHIHQSVVVMAALGELSLDRPGLVSGIVQSERLPAPSHVALATKARTKKSSAEQTTANAGHSDPGRGLAAKMEAR